MNSNNRFPLWFKYRFPVVGNGFVAKVEALGRAVLEQELEGGWTMYGVNPGGMAGCGGTKTEATRDFEKGFHEVLDDFAHEYDSFETFSEAVIKFVEDTCDHTLEDWITAVAEVRAGRTDLDSLQRWDSASTKVSVTVAELQRQQMNPSVNRSDDLAQAC